VRRKMWLWPCTHSAICCVVCTEVLCIYLLSEPVARMLLWALCLPQCSPCRLNMQLHSHHSAAAYVGKIDMPHHSRNSLRSRLQPPLRAGWCILHTCCNLAASIKCMSIQTAAAAL
jgi:hypothetical protein